MSGLRLGGFGAVDLEPHPRPLELDVHGPAIGELLVAGQLRHVCVATDSWRKTALPEAIRRGLARFLDEAHPPGAAA